MSEGQPNIAPKAATFRVIEAEKHPGHLYFFTPDAQPIPREEIAAQKDLERIASVLRIVFPVSARKSEQKHGERDPLFRDKFEELLTLAQSVFSPQGFRPELLSSLDIFKDEIVQVAGPTIKANYVKRLAIWVIVAFVSILIATFAYDPVARFMGESRGSEPSPTGPYVSIRNTGLLLAFSMWGLFFASVTRNLTPTFDSLRIPDADLMLPWVRLAFYGIAVLVLAMAFQVKLVTVALGDTFSTESVNKHAGIAILVGLLLGISERAVPREVSKWAAELVRRSSPQPTSEPAPGSPAG